MKDSVVRIVEHQRHTCSFCSSRDMQMMDLGRKRASREFVSAQLDAQEARVRAHLTWCVLAVLVFIGTVAATIFDTGSTGSRDFLLGACCFALAHHLYKYFFFRRARSMTRSRLKELY
jgi:uncharacterized membrane protein